MEGIGSVTRLGILGGTFDPIHIGHLVAASEALHRFRLDRVVLVPAGRPWQKAAYSDPEDRLVMTTLAAAAHPRLAVSRIEIDRHGPTYTIDTLESFRSFFGDAGIYFIVGVDALPELGTWHRIDEMGKLADIIAVTRPGWGSSFTPEPSWPQVHVMEMPGIDVSSTDIRARVAAGAPVDFLVPAEVARYVRERGLYVEGTEEARLG